MLAVRLSDQTERRLEALAAWTGRTKTFYPRAAIEAHLDDLEDFCLAEERLRDVDAADAIPLSSLKAEFGLDDRICPGGGEGTEGARPAGRGAGHPNTGKGIVDSVNLRTLTAALVGDHVG